MPGFLLAISTSLSWGVSDFLGGLTARAVPVPRVLAISQSAGLLLITVVTFGWGHRLPGGASALLAGLAGVSSVAALGLFYAAMTRASMIVIAPVASTGAMIAVAIGLIRGEAITMVAAAGIVLALIGAPAAAWEPGRKDHHRGRGSLGAWLAAGAGVATGLWLTFMNLASQGDPLGATEVMRLTSCVIAIAVFACYRSAWPNRRRTSPAPVHSGQAGAPQARPLAPAGARPGAGQQGTAPAALAVAVMARRPADASQTGGLMRPAGRFTRLGGRLRLQGGRLILLGGRVRHPGGRVRHPGGRVAREGGVLRLAGGRVRRGLARRGALPLLAIMAIGVTDAMAEIAYAMASAAGQLSIVSALSSLYPAVTVLLAAVILRERVHPVQAAGAMTALAAAVLLAL
jgi:drug/metabolite transporter (DMT)-like permease